VLGWRSPPSLQHCNSSWRDTETARCQNWSRHFELFLVQCK
jgi:hypothetical protein